MCFIYIVLNTLSMLIPVLPTTFESISLLHLWKCSSERLKSDITGSVAQITVYVTVWTMHLPLYHLFIYYSVIKTTKFFVLPHLYNCFFLLDFKFFEYKKIKFLSSNQSSHDDIICCSTVLVHSINFMRVNTEWGMDRSLLF